VTVTAPDRRSSILAAASSLMAEHGSRGTSIAAVAQRAGLTDAGVLYHFKTKKDLLLAVVEQFDSGVERSLAEGGSRGIELIRAMRDWGIGMEQVPEIQSLLIVLTAEQLHEDGPARDYLTRRYRRLLDRYTKAFADAVAAGDLRADLDPAFEASAFVAHLDGIRFQWFLLDGEISIADSVRDYVDTTLRRLAP
jgi:AcrR family transcriptional regulator